MQPLGIHENRCLSGSQAHWPKHPRKKGRDLNKFPKGKYRLIWHQARGGGFPALKECEGERGGAEKTEKKERKE